MIMKVDMKKLYKISKTSISNVQNQLELLSKFQRNYIPTHNENIETTYSYVQRSYILTYDEKKYSG